MNLSVRLLLWSVLALAQLDLLESSPYRCGIRQPDTLNHGWETGADQWPWHVAVFHKHEGIGFRYAGGATLVSERHVLVTALNVVKRRARNSLPAILYEIELHFGQQNLSKVTDNVVIRDVSKTHVHPEYTSHRNDIAVLVMRLAVEFSQYVFPICLEQTVDSDIRDLEGQRGWITGWGRTENGTISDELRTMTLPVVSYLQCLKNDPIMFAKLLNEMVFCAGNLNGTDPGVGYNGGGMYISYGNQWRLRGILSSGILDKFRQEIDSSKYLVFVNVPQYLAWIEDIFAETETVMPRLDLAPSCPGKMLGTRVVNR